jgi:MFS family permease
MSTANPTTRPTGAEAVDLRVVQRRTLRVLVIAQIFSGAGLAAGVTVGALLAQRMLGSSDLSGLPSALFTAGSAAAALIVGSVSNRSGRRPGLVGGYLAGAIGGALVVLAAALDSAALLFPALLIYGSGSATNLQARYAGADLAATDRRGTAISTVLVATTLGAVGGPLLVSTSGRLAHSLGLPTLSGPFLVATIAYGLAAAVLSTWLRPDPLLVARSDVQITSTALDRPLPDDTLPIPQANADTTNGDEPGGMHDEATQVANRQRAGDATGIALGAAAMVLTQLIMVAIMTMTPVDMHQHGLGLGATGIVIAVHIGMMYLPSPVTGRVADRYGPRTVILAGTASLLAAGLLASAASGHSTTLLAIALGLLGLGWNLGLLGGTTLVTSAAELDHRARIQGRVDLAVALSGTTGGLASGMIMTITSYSVLTFGGGLLALVMLPTALRGR